MAGRLKVCFIGLGSIAKRHINNLKFVSQKKGIDLSIDAYRHRINSAVIEGIDHIYYHINQIPNDYDVIFITNPTNLHFSSLKSFHEKGKHFFIEKPAASIEEIEEAQKFRQRKESIYYVACPLRYHAVIQYIKENMDRNNVISVRSISSSYLPDWRPGQDYRNSYSAHRKLGGGVSMDLIHEWDYMTYLFGWPEHVLYLSGKKSDLEIDSDDYAIYIAEYQDKIAELHLDYFGRNTIREIQLFTKDQTIVGDIVNSQIRFLSDGHIIDFCEERDDFQKRELDHFLNMVFGDEKIENNYMHAIKVLGLTQGRLISCGIYK